MAGAAPNVSPDLSFTPVVTQFQLVVEMILVNTAPAGHGHACYARDCIGPWAAVTDPEGWTAADSARLAAHCDNG
ncbi:alpha/beta-hydrolase family protein [Paracoccus sp. (in: a-proteobacteria)]|uniref:alpha/beta-hydrolase family protein n=1 Tax=Paracoccus sp. TaxID=267 RepID=UPI0026DEC9B0|nr:alpha/beta-hydrolase family protein [Paracoccus sp. (in: a-proteobacteria)]MDO5371647.1 alpha/beta-hydrolase family protein [Paracoccus sp. (in: a-proteobacteria)]